MTKEALEVMADGVLAIDAAVEFAGISRAELYRRMTAGQLVYSMQGRRRFIPKRALIAMLATGLRGGGAR
jgi:predicted DNA-binding transcriptional regulator AlpA